MGFIFNGPFATSCFIYAATILTTGFYQIKVILAAMVSLLVAQFSPKYYTQARSVYNFWQKSTCMFITLTPPILRTTYYKRPSGILKARSIQGRAIAFEIIFYIQIVWSWSFLSSTQPYFHYSCIHARFSSALLYVDMTTFPINWSAVLLIPVSSKRQPWTVGFAAFTIKSHRSVQPGKIPFIKR